MKRLAVAETAGDIPSVFRAMCVNSRPGFQVAPDVPLDACLEELERFMQIELGQRDFEFNYAFGNAAPQHPVVGDGTSPDIGHTVSPRHIDEDEAKRRVGVAVHHDLNGFGRVVLQLARPGVTDIITDGRLVGLRNRLNAVGGNYEGTLIPDIKTVFSEGLVAVSGLQHVDLGAAFHEFIGAGEAQRQWTRYTCSP